MLWLCSFLKYLKQIEFWAALSIIIATVVLMILDRHLVFYIGFYVGPFRLSHWLVWIGTSYIAIIVPIIAILKKTHPKKYLTLYRIHVFGNLIAFAFISLHFIAQISRPAAVFPQLGTGLALYIDMILLVGTGFTHRFELIHQIKSQTRKFIHVGLTFSFYIIIIIHILHGLNII
jgi:hypothetical protein